eukprot:Sdes_comp18015_c0_seq4m7303
MLRWLFLGKMPKRERRISENNSRNYQINPSITFFPSTRQEPTSQPPSSLLPPKWEARYIFPPPECRRNTKSPQQEAGIFRGLRYPEGKQGKVSDLWDESRNEGENVYINVLIDLVAVFDHIEGASTFTNIEAVMRDFFSFKHAGFCCPNVKIFHRSASIDIHNFGIQEARCVESIAGFSDRGGAKDEG